MGKKKTGSAQSERCCGCGEMVDGSTEEILHCSGCGDAVCSLCVNTQTDGETFCPSCLEMALDRPDDPSRSASPVLDSAMDMVKPEDFKTTISMDRPDGTTVEADLEDVKKAMDQKSYMVISETMRDEALRKDADERRRSRIKIRILEEEIKSRRDEIKGLQERVSSLGDRMSTAILDPQLYLDEIRRELELENALSRGEDPSQLTLEDE